MFRLYRPLAFGLICLFTGVTIGSQAQETPPPEKAKTVSIPQSFRMYLVHDKRYKSNDVHNREGKLHCPVCEHGLFTVLGVFSRHIPKDKEDPLYLVLEKQEALAKKYKDRRMGAFVAFISLARDFPDDETRESLTQQIADLGRNAKLEQVALGLAEATMVPEGADPFTNENLKDASQVAAWGLKDEDDITIVLYHRFNVVKRLSFTKDKPPTEADLKTIGDSVAEIMARK